MVAKTTELGNKLYSFIYNINEIHVSLSGRVMLTNSPVFELCSVGEMVQYIAHPSYSSHRFLGHHARLSVVLRTIRGLCRLPALGPLQEEERGALDFLLTALGPS